MTEQYVHSAETAAPSRSIHRSIWRLAQKSVKRMLPRDKVVGKKNFRGTLWDRLRGLDFVLDDCQDRTVLDITSCEGLVSYEFVRRGARLVHGFERDRDRVNFSRRLFRDVPVECRFERANLAISGNTFVNSFGSFLLPRYDIVLFLGAYHHLRRQMPEAELAGLVTEFLKRAETYFVVRTKKFSQFESLILSHGFELVHAPAYEDLRTGPLRIYKRLQS